MEQPARPTHAQRIDDRVASSTADSSPLHVTHWQPSAGEANCRFGKDHTLFISRAPRPVLMFHRMESKTFTGLSGRGDMSFAPADTELFARWDRDDDYLEVRICADFVQQVADESLRKAGSRLELVPNLHLRSGQLETIGQSIFSELQQDSPNRLYLDSLANILAIDLVRGQGITTPIVPTYTGGLPPHQLQRVLDYIDAHLSRDLKLADLAQLLEMSPFHFSRLFKQSIGRSPHQYLIQQRVEKAKRLLERTDLRILDIALECGFSSHSHLTKKFRQFTGVTPKAFRAG